MNNSTPYFAPHMSIPGGVKDVSFYTKAFDAIEMHRWTNDDGSVHVAEFSLNGFLFHVHEEKISSGEFSPGRIGGTTSLIGMFVPDVDAVMNKAINAGAEVVSPAKTYEYGYRQGQVKDPFGHVWLIEAKV